MYIICLLLLFMILYEIKLDKEQSYFFSKEYTQSWKGILCIGILMTHILEKFNWPNVLYHIHSFGYIEVAIFFMFSGYGLKYSLNNKENYMNDFFKKRFLKIYLPYLICGFICYLLRNVLLLKDNLNLLSIIKMATGYNAIWFIKALLIFYIAFWIIYRYFPKQGNIIMGIFIIVYMLVCFVSKVDKTWYGSVIPFFIGILLADNIEKIRKVKINPLYIIPCGILACILEFMYNICKDDALLGSLIIRNLLCIVITTFFILVTLRIKVCNRFTNFFGKISYEIFLLHFTCITIIRTLADTRVSIEIQALLIFLLSVIMAFILNKIDSVVVRKICK